MRRLLGLATIVGFSLVSSSFRSFAADTKSTDQPSSDPTQPRQRQHHVSGQKPRPDRLLQAHINPSPHGRGAESMTTPT